MHSWLPRKKRLRWHWPYTGAEPPLAHILLFLTQGISGLREPPGSDSWVKMTFLCH